MANDEILNALMNRNRLLREAAANGDIVDMLLLLSDGADLNSKDPVGRTPLDLALQSSHPNREKAADILRSRGGQTGAVNLDANPQGVPTLDFTPKIQTPSWPFPDLDAAPIPPVQVEAFRARNLAPPGRSAGSGLRKKRD